MENSKYFAVNIGGYEWYDLFIINTETSKNILNGLDIYFDKAMWSQDRQVLLVESRLNEFDGSGGEVLFVSDYGNPDQLNEVIRIPKEK